MPISEEQPPDNTDYRLSEWLTRIFRQARTEDAAHRRSILELVPAGYGGGIQDADIAHDILASFNTVPFDTLGPAVSRGVSFNLANNTFTFTAKGVWTLLFNLSLQGFNNLNAGRNFIMRLFNVTQSTAGQGVVVGIGRNTEDALITFSALNEVSQSNVDNADEFRVEVGSANTDITGGTIIYSSIQFTHSSELGALL